VTDSGQRRLEERVLLLAPTARDAATTQSVLGHVGVHSAACATIPALCAELARGAGAIILTEHASTSPDVGMLVEHVRRQPPWSDLPVLALAAGGAESAAGRRAMELFGNVTVLERPVQMASLASVVRTLIRSRLRQYQIRQHLLDRDRAADELRRSEATFRELADAMPQIVWAARPDGSLDYYNRRWYEFTGMPRGGGGDESWTGALHPDDLRPALDTWYAAVRSGEPYQIEYRIRDHRTGEYRWHLGRALPVRDAAGAVVRWYGTSTDIDDQKRAAREREALLASERAARSEAERVGRVKDEFLATLSHELRTPLNAILGWSQLLLGGPRVESELNEGLESIARNAQAQTQIIEDLLDMSRIISGKIRLDVQETDLSRVIAAAVDTVRPAADAKEIRVEKVTAPAAPDVVYVDPNRLQQVFWNLLSNAVKFTPRGGRVRVAVTRSDSLAEVTVSDTGEGIRPEFLPHVFDRFRQEDASTTRRHGGLGLGLAIVKQLVELHGGTVRAESAGHGQGASFVISLPLTAPHPPPDPEPQRQERHVTATRPAQQRPVLRGVKVLVVDDEPDALALLRRLLEGYHAAVSTAASAGEAFDLVLKDPPDVLVSDIGMPGEDGYSLMRKVRALGNGTNGSIPAVALTAYARPEDRSMAIQSGFQLHVTKPVEPDELIAIVASLAGKARGAGNGR
jgi:PAS domain S-box-containing protein